MDQCHETLKSSVGYTEDRKPQKFANGKINYKRKPPSQRKTKTPSPTKSKSRKKCPRKMDMGMPQFEHFPLKEILKEGVDNDCQDASYSSFDDWDLEEDNLEKDYDDYVQPTKKPLVFKEFFNERPLSGPSKENNYDYSREHAKKNEVRRKDQGSTGYVRNEETYEKIPDLPPPDSFPNLFSNLPTAYGDENGFMNNYDKDKEISVKPISFNPKLVPGPVEKMFKPTTYKPKLKNYKIQSP